MSDPKRFDDYSEVVDCNECSHYWDGACDGASKGSKVGCNSFLATRSIVIPEKINALENRVNWLSGIIFFMLTLLVVLTYVVLTRWC